MEKRNKGGWNYRMIRTRVDENEATFAIYEVHYTDDVPTSFSAVPMHPEGDSPNHLLEDIMLMAKAYSQPPLEVWPKENGDGERLVEVSVNNETGKSKATDPL